MLLNPIDGLTLNITITGLIFLYLSLLALLPFSWLRAKGDADDGTRKRGNQEKSRFIPYLFNKPKIILTALLATLLFLGGILVYFGSYHKMMDPIKEVTLNITITGLIFLYLSLLALLPFSWLRAKGDADDGTRKRGNQEKSRFIPYLFNKPKIILTALLATLLFLGGILVYFGSYHKMMDPIKEVTLNITIIGLIFLYLSLLALLPFSWKRINYGVNNKTNKQNG